MVSYLFAVVSITLLCLVSASQSAPPVCEKLLHPSKQLDPHHLVGRWALVAGSLNHAPSMEALRLRDSITMYFSNSSDATNFSQYLPYNISVVGSTFTFDVGNRFNLTGYFLYTSCPDCLVMQWAVKSSKRVSLDLYLLSRRREVEQNEMEEFRAQLECHQLPTPVVMDPTKELCPEQPESQPTAAAAAAAAAVAPQSEETMEGLKA